ncbi:MAG: hypothetical protein AAGF11_55045 [Myxococcota bacterium]
MLSGCPGASGGSAPAVVPGETEPASLGPDVFVQSTGVGATEDEAYMAARVALAEAVLGDPAWAELVAVDLHRRNEDPQRVTSVADGVEVALGLTRARVSVAISDLENGERAVQGPMIWREPLQAYVRAHVAAQACERRRVLFEVECETGQTEEADAAVVATMEGVDLVSAYPDGVPVDAEGRPLREPVVFALWRGVPVPDLPLRIGAEQPEALAQSRLSSDAQGRAQVALVQGTALPPIQIRVDTESLLGPHRADLPQAELRIEPRAVGTSRWAVVVTRGTTKGRGDEVARVLRRRVESAGLGAPVDLPPRDTESLRAAPLDRQGARVAAIGDAMSGSIDLLLVLSYDTRFASRMGGGRVWYEAEGTVRIFDVWTGQVRAESSTTVRANGVGDAGADTAVRKKLAEALAKPVLASLQGG